MRKYDSKIRAQQAEITKSQIAKTFEKLIHSKDIRSISIKEICKEAGVSVGTFYLYFENKEEALLYNYHISDDIFSNIELEKDRCPIENLNIILNKYIEMIDFNLMNNMRQTYIAHLMYFDEYFFSWDRGLICKILECVDCGQQQGRLTTEYSNKEITIKILRFIRGCLYDLLIREKLIDLESWKSEVIVDINKYVSIFNGENRE